MANRIPYEPELLDGLEGEDVGLYSDLHQLPVIERRAYKDQYWRLAKDGGPEGTDVINKVPSPGKLVCEEDGETLTAKETPRFVDMNGYRFYWLTPANKEDLLGMLRQGSIDALYLSRTTGIDESLFQQALQPSTHLRGVAISLTVNKTNRFDLSVLGNHPQLEYVSWDEPPTKPVSLGGLTNLRKAAITWSPHVVGLANLERLTWLRLAKYKPESGNLDELGSLETLEDLELVQGSFTDLSAVSRLRKLKNLSLAYIRSALQLGTIASESLRVLEIDHCGGVTGRLSPRKLPALTKVWGHGAPKW